MMNERESVPDLEFGDEPVEVESTGPAERAWETAWRTGDGKREMQHTVDGGDYLKRFRDGHGEEFKIAEVAPWVAKEHVEIHAKASVRK